jgi:hypothetical protein
MLSSISLTSARRDGTERTSDVTDWLHQEAYIDVLSLSLSSHFTRVTGIVVRYVSFIYRSLDGFDDTSGSYAFHPSTTLIGCGIFCVSGCQTFGLRSVSRAILSRSRSCSVFIEAVGCCYYECASGVFLNLLTYVRLQSFGSSQPQTMPA